jgi:ATP-dependent RNA helicase DHX36
MNVISRCFVRLDGWNFNFPFVQVVIPLSLQRRVEGLLQEHLDRTQLSAGKVGGNADDASINQIEDTSPDENPDSFLDRSVMERVLQRRSLRMRNMQRAWQA